VDENQGRVRTRTLLSGMSRRGRAAVVGAVIAAIAVGGIGIALGRAAATPASTAAPSATHSTPNPQPSTDAEPSPTPSGRAEETAAEPATAQASAAVSALVDLGATVLKDPASSVDDLDAIGEVAAGFVRGEIESLAIERAELGYTQRGQARIVSIDEADADLTAETPSITLDVCIDSSDLEVFDSAGTSLAGSMYQPGHPVMHVYGAQLLDGTWKIVTHDIPDSPDACS